MSGEKLFNEFPPITTEQWEEVIIKDLKGADYQKKLIWKTDEGFNVRPYYRAEDLANLDYLDTMPAQFPYTRGTKKDNNNWQIVQEVNESDVAKANTIALDALKRGANTIAFNVKNVKDANDLAALLKGIDCTKTGLQFDHAQNYVDFMTLFVNYLNDNKIDKEAVAGSINFDPITYYLRRTKFYRSQEADMAELLKLHELAADMKNFKLVNVNGIAIHNAGSTIVQELAYSLGIANEYIAYATEHGIPVGKACKKIQLTLSVGSNYFFEIAKLRAARLLWATMVEQYQPTCDCGYKLQINTVGSTWNKTLYDPYVNMLRNTTEGMAAALGGADAISLQPFDVAYKEDDDFSRRISRNVQVILKEESYFNKVVDPAAGSYYIENLTDGIAENAWKLFQHVEAEGGMIQLIGTGEIKREIEASCQKRDMNIATRRLIFLGTNQYPNVNEKMLDKIERMQNDDSIGLRTYRGATAFEELRLETERYAKDHHRPKVFLLKVGNLAMRQARAGFITNFFGCAGYEIAETAGYKTVEDGVKAAEEQKADLVVICSSDEEYATLGVEIAAQLKNKLPQTPVLIAGNPTEAIEALNAAGVCDYIHVKVNVLDTLRRYNQQLLK